MFLLIILNLYLNIHTAIYGAGDTYDACAFDESFWNCGLSLGRFDIFNVEQGHLKQL